MSSWYEMLWEIGMVWLLNSILLGYKFYACVLMNETTWNVENS